ncbi:MAG TPA: DPP IV N-terminal domain-containing protein [Ignavibacteria bacterium]|nr:DPP IV N-terminal domain-containing protein [Ignavibacteria bacterium]
MSVKSLKYFTFLSMILFYFNCNDEIIEPDSSPVAGYTQIDFEPSVTNDNTKIVYVHSNVDFELTGIYIYDLLTNSNSLFKNGFIRSPDWSPDSKWIVYSLSNNLYKIKSNGDSLTILTNLANSGNNMHPKWSEDGSKIAFANTDCSSSDQCGVYTMNTDGSEITLIEPNAIYPEWTDNGNALFFLKQIKNTNGQPAGDSLFKYSLTNNLKELITVFSGNEHILNSYLNSTGNDIIFCSTSETGFSYVYKYNLLSGSLTKLSQTQGYSPFASDFSEKTVYTNRDQGNGRLCIMNNDGSYPVQITP